MCRGFPQADLRLWVTGGETAETHSCVPSPGERPCPAHAFITSHDQETALGGPGAAARG